MTRGALVLLSWALLQGAEGASGQQDTSGTSPRERIEEWILDLPLPPGAIAEATRFEEGGRRLDGALAEARVRGLRTAALEALSSTVARLEDRGCVPSVDVTFPDAADWSAPVQDGIQRAFLRGIVRTVAVACFRSDASPQEVLELYTSPPFRMEAESRIEGMWEENQTTCIHTGGVPLLLAPTEACSQVARLLEPDLAVEHSQVVHNSSEAGIQPVYFKESLKSFLRVPGGLAFIYVNYSRSTDLGRASRWVARGKIRESQEAQAEALRRRIEG